MFGKDQNGRPASVEREDTFSMGTRSDIINSSFTLQDPSAFSRATTIKVSNNHEDGFNVLNRTPTEMDLEFLDIDNLDEASINI
jgi:hypothetical protein